ncbi:MAG: nicotinate-nucleotide adenylyltransferase [Clostridia bacterium]|nr:nicotinate-nucleotide adenylyltransferase [Clostridia bacterium]
MIKAGIYGGTFDPVHKGHIKCAEEVKKALSLDKIIFVPAGNPPHKFANPISLGRDRHNMLKAAVSGHEGFEICDAELLRTGYTFTADTLPEIEKRCPGHEFYYIMGSDAAAGFLNWYKAESIIARCRLVLVERPGDAQSDIDAIEKALRAAGAGTLVIKVEGLIDVSSSEIRRCVRERDEGLLDRLPAGVAQYIAANGLYREGAGDEEFIRADLERILKPERFVHSLGVAEEAERLAVRFGADPDKARLAGLLHDCAKNVKAEQLRWIGMKLEDFALTAGDGFREKLLHGPLGAIVAEKRYGIRDPEILDAVRKHTTGDYEMSLLDDIIFLADYTEKNRKGAFFEEIRVILDEWGIRKAELFAANELLVRFASNNAPVNIRTVIMRNRIIEEMNG